MQSELFAVGGWPCVIETKRERISVKVETEQWKPCPGFPAYEVSSFGRFKRIRTGRIMSTGNKRDVYPVAQLMREGKQHRGFAHRLVCTAFNGPAPDGKPFVNHIDGDKTNNAASNLEWVSHSENAKHSWGMIKGSKLANQLVERYVTCHNSV